jgi:hypothetical protein
MTPNELQAMKSYMLTSKGIPTAALDAMYRMADEIERLVKKLERVQAQADKPCSTCLTIHQQIEATAREQQKKREREDNIRQRGGTIGGY